MKSVDLLDLIGDADEKLIRDAKKKGRHRLSRLTCTAAAAACLCLVLFGVWNTLDRMDVSFFAASCGSSPGRFSEGNYYYYVRHRGVFRYTPEAASELVLHTYWFDESWDVNGYGIYYQQGRSVYVRDHATGTRTKLYTAGTEDGTTHISFLLREDGSVIVTHYDKNAGSARELRIDGRTGENRETVMPTTPHSESKYAFYSRTHYTVGERQIELIPEGEHKDDCRIVENGQERLPGILVGHSYGTPDRFGGALWLTVREPAGERIPGQARYAVLRPEGGTELVTLPDEYYEGGSAEYLFAVKNGEVLCAEIRTGESWLLVRDTQADFHDLASDGNYLFTTAPWDHIQTCWKIVYDDGGKPASLTLISPDVVPD